MIDHKSIINLRIDTPMGRRHGDNDSVETYELNPPRSPLPNGASSSAERTEDPPGESKAIFDGLVTHKLKLPSSRSAAGHAL